MGTSYIPIMHHKKMAVTDKLFCVVIEFLVKWGKSAGVTHKWLNGVYGDASMGASSVRRWVMKHFKDGNMEITNQPGHGQLRTAATEHNKQKVNEIIRQDTGG